MLKPKTKKPRKRPAKKRTPKKDVWQKFKPDQVIKALQESKGVKTIAAKALNCDRTTIINYCKKYPEVEKASIESREQLVDLAEEGLIHQLEEKYFPAIKYTLSTLGKDRGYIEKSELHGVFDVTETKELEFDFSNLTLDEKEKLSDAMMKAAKIEPEIEQENI